MTNKTGKIAEVEKTDSTTEITKRTITDWLANRANIEKSYFLVLLANIAKRTKTVNLRDAQKATKPPQK
ncbi:hypothetical protein G3I44_08960 [Halogeometricum borinquense]|uniref:Uncharacterized protein n=1 Tax=Halogeometricum borinquense TaxID=60847 RepID=A0A6C0UN94_9EURY|nr:hypothetical protein [Halogeometricum borinquense]QIB74398.1 hypothetical protein G3I44_08960 [Halogeometricum borinquense]